MTMFKNISITLTVLTATLLGGCAAEQPPGDPGAEEAAPATDEGTSEIEASGAALTAVTDDFDICAPNCDLGSTFGTITWFNRTANIDGYVFDVGPGNTTAVFEAFAGATKIDSTTRTADDESTGATQSPRAYDITIGDTNLPGGINRIKITVCFNFGTPSQNCANPVNISKLRPGALGRARDGRPVDGGPVRG